MIILSLSRVHTFITSRKLFYFSLSFPSLFLILFHFVIAKTKNALSENVIKILARRVSRARKKKKPTKRKMKDKKRYKSIESIWIAISSLSVRLSNLWIGFSSYFFFFLFIFYLFLLYENTNRFQVVFTDVWLQIYLFLLVFRFATTLIHKKKKKKTPKIEEEEKKTSNKTWKKISTMSPLLDYDSVPDIHARQCDVFVFRY